MPGKLSETTIYADIAVRYARSIRGHQVLAFIISAIHIKAQRGELLLGGLEAGFFDRLGRLAYVGSFN